MESQQPTSVSSPKYALDQTLSGWPSQEMVEFGALILRYWQLHAPDKPETIAREMFRGMMIAGRKLALAAADRPNTSFEPPECEIVTLYEKLRTVEAEVNKSIVASARGRSPS